MKYAEKLIEDIIEALDNASYEVKYYFNKKIKRSLFLPIQRCTLQLPGRTGKMV